jgi:hypothetical protein
MPSGMFLSLRALLIRPSAMLLEHKLETLLRISFIFKPMTYLTMLSAAILHSVVDTE